MGAAPEMPAEGQKKPWVKLVVALVVVIVIIAAVAVYFLTQQPTPAVNKAPTISTTSADRSAADISQTISFTASATDPDGDTLTYSWDFGDATSLTGATVTHGYPYPGNYIAIVTVSDGKGHNVSSDTKPVFILVNQAANTKPTSLSAQPAPVAVVSSDRSVLQANDTSTFNGNSSWTWAYQTNLCDTDNNGVPDTVCGWQFNSAATNATAIPTLAYDFGDGTTLVTGSPLTYGQLQHRFSAPGSHFVKLNVTNYLAKTSITGYTVRVSAVSLPSGFVKNPDIFTEVVFGEPDSVDPAFDYETSGGQVIQNVAETLIWYDREKADVYKPMLATKVPDPTSPADVSPDKTIWNFTLRSGLTFTSGNPVNCAAVAFSIKRVLWLNDPDGPAWILDQSLTAYASDNLTTPNDERHDAINASVSCPSGNAGLQVQFHLAFAYPAFLSTLAFTAASILDPAPTAYRVSGRCPTTDLANSYCHDQIVGTGPFKLRVWQPNQQIILDANPTYWNAAAKAVPFKEVHIIKANDVATRVLMLKAGDADSISLPFNHKNDIRDTGGNVLPGISEYSGNTFVVQFLGMNRNIVIDPTSGDNIPANFFADVHVRKGFSYAWRYADFIQNVVFGYGSSICSAVPNGMFGYDSTVPCYTTDAAKAQAEFQAAVDGRPGASGSYWDNGFTLTVYYNVGNTVREEGSRLLKTAMAALNPKFVVNVIGLEWATFLQKQRARVFPLFFLGWAPDYSDPDDYVYPFLHSNQTFTKRIGYVNATLDGLIDQAAGELDPVVRLSLLNEIQHSVFYDVPYIWLYQAKSNDVFRTWVTGYYSNPMTTAGTGNYYYDLDK